MSEAMLKVSKLNKQFMSGDSVVDALKNASLRVDKGQFASIIGRSGSGKSTLLSVLGGLDSPTSGSIEVNGTDITKLSDHALINYRCKEIGFVFQSYNLIPNLTAEENVCLPMEFAKVPLWERKSRATELLNLVGLDEHKQKRKPGKLSGGEQQRVAIARALANKPKFILADEPTGNLDSQTGKMIFDLLHELTRKEGTTIVVVTHDLSIAGKTDVTFTLQDGALSSSR